MKNKGNGIKGKQILDDFFIFIKALCAFCTKMIDLVPLNHAL